MILAECLLTPTRVKEVIELGSELGKTKLTADQFKPNIFLLVPGRNTYGATGVNYTKTDASDRPVTLVFIPNLFFRIPGKRALEVLFLCANSLPNMIT